MSFDFEIPQTKEEKVKDQEMEFNADSLEMEKDLNPDIKTEPVEHDEKELQNVKKNKIEKFNEDITVETRGDVDWDIIWDRFKKETPYYKFPISPDCVIHFLNFLKENYSAQLRPY